jgi:hypothetical protein
LASGVCVRLVIAVPPVATSYQNLVLPVAHVALLNVTVAPAQMLEELTLTLVGIAGSGFIVIAAVATLVLEQVPPFWQVALYVTLAVGKTVKPLPVPRLEPPVATLYQLIVPIAQVAERITGVPEHDIVLLADTAVGATTIDTFGPNILVLGQVAVLQLA